MGLKRDNYKVTSLGLDLASAYARITDVSVDLNGRAHAIFKIQQDREQIGRVNALETIVFSVQIDKDLPLHEQVYTASKQEGQPFEGWEDDIVKQ